MTKLFGRLLKQFSCLACLMFTFAESLAQESTANSIHWAYSSYFGGGCYRLSGNRDVLNIQSIPRWESKESRVSGDA